MTDRERIEIEEIRQKYRRVNGSATLAFRKMRRELLFVLSVLDYKQDDLDSREKALKACLSVATSYASADMHAMNVVAEIARNELEK